MQGPSLDGFRERLAFKALRIITGPGESDLAERTSEVLNYAEVHFGLIAEEVEVLRKAGRHPAIACKKGCAHCCHTLVEATLAEVKALARYIEDQMTIEQRRYLDTKLQIHVDKVAKLGADELRPPMPCPLLEDDCCTVHPARPLACRTFNSVDVSACIKARENWREPAHIPAVGKQVIAASGIHDGLIAGLDAIGESTEMLEMPTALLAELNR